MSDIEWSADAAITWNERERAVYETGYREGGGNRQVDWFIALTEYCELPDEIDTENPTQVAEYIAHLQAEVARLTAEQRPHVRDCDDCGQRILVTPHPFVLRGVQVIDHPPICRWCDFPEDDPIHDPEVP
jgi:hypothetical protein